MAVAAAGTVVEEVAGTGPGVPPAAGTVEEVVAETGPGELPVAGTAVGLLPVETVEVASAEIAAVAPPVGTALAGPPAAETAAGEHLAGTVPGLVEADDLGADQAAGTG